MGETIQLDFVECSLIFRKKIEGKKIGINLESMGESLFDITAMDIGITCNDWTFIAESENLNAAAILMNSKKFDVLPIKDGFGNFSSFYVTKDWNEFEKEKISRKEIAELPKLKYDTKFLELLNYFDESGNKYAVLMQNEEVRGLISIVNFSWSEIYYKLYQILHEFELQLSDWIFEKKNTDEIIEAMISSSEGQGNKDIAIGSYLIDERKGLNNHLKEYFFLTNLLSLVSSLDLYKDLGFSSSKKFRKATKHLSDVRNNVAHPVRRMIKRADDFKDLKNSLITLNDIKVKMK